VIGRRGVPVTITFSLQCTTKSRGLPIPKVPAAGTSTLVTTGPARKLATTLFADCTSESVHVKPEQSPLNPVKRYPVAPLAVQVLDCPWPTGLGEQVTVPAADGLATAAMA